MDEKMTPKLTSLDQSFKNILKKFSLNIVRTFCKFKVYPSEDIDLNEAAFVDTLLIEIQQNKHSDFNNLKNCCIQYAKLCFLADPHNGIGMLQAIFDFLSYVKLMNRGSKNTIENEYITSAVKDFEHISSIKLTDDECDMIFVEVLQSIFNSEKPLLDIDDFEKLTNDESDGFHKEKQREIVIQAAKIVRQDICKIFEQRCFTSANNVNATNLNKVPDTLITFLNTVIYDSIKSNAQNENINDGNSTTNSNNDINDQSEQRNLHDVINPIFSDICKAILKE